MFLISCGSPPQDYAMQEEEMAVSSGCFSEYPEAYNYSSARWDKDTIYYHNASGSYDYEISRAASIISEHIGKPIVVSDSSKADIVVYIDWIDKGGKIVNNKYENTLGLAHFPPTSSISIYPVPIIIDEYDLAAVEGRTAYDFFRYFYMNYAMQ